MVLPETLNGDKWFIEGKGSKYIGGYNEYSGALAGTVVILLQWYIEYMLANQEYVAEIVRCDAKDQSCGDKCGNNCLSKLKGKSVRWSLHWQSIAIIKDTLVLNCGMIIYGGECILKKHPTFEGSTVQQCSRICRWYLCSRLFNVNLKFQSIQ